MRSRVADITRQLRLPGWRGVRLLVTLMAAFVVTTIAQDAPGAVPGQETPRSLARLLAGRKAFAALPVKGKVKRDIKMDDQTYPMADGPRRVVLLKLPDNQELTPSRLRATSTSMRSRSNLESSCPQSWCSTATSR